MIKNRFYLLRVLVAVGLVFSLALATPMQAFADDGTPDDPTPEITEAPAAEETEAEDAVADEAPVEEPSEEAATEEAASEEPTEEAASTEEATEEATPSEEPVEETIAEVAQAIAETDSVLVDENGDVLSLASEDAAELLGSADPWFEDGGITYHYYSLADCPASPGTYDFCSSTPIQDAVDAAPVGATVHVEAGTYTEQVVINKNLTLQGSSGAIIKSPANLTDHFDTSKSNYPIIYVYDADNVTISGFTVDGDGLGNANYSFVGIGYYNAGGTISGNTVTGITDTPFSGGQHGTAIYVYNDGTETKTVVIENNHVENYQKGGIVAAGNDLTANIIDNVVEGVGSTNRIAQNGIQLGYGATGEISGNTVTGHHWDGPTWTSAGVLIYLAGDGLVVSDNNISGNQTNLYVQDTNAIEILNNIISDSTGFDNVDIYYVDGATITGNTITGAVMDGMWIGESANLAISGNTFEDNGTSNPYAEAGGIHLWSNDLTGISINGNSFVGNLNGVYNEDVAILDAEGNWWGCVEGPGNAGCDPAGGNVDFTPWLTVAPPATDADLDGVADNFDNCPNVANTDQADNDNDGVGNACDRRNDNETGDGTTGPTTTGGGGLIIPVTGAGFFESGGVSLSTGDIDGATVGVTELAIAGGAVEAYGVAFSGVTSAFQLTIPATDGILPTITLTLTGFVDGQIVTVILPDGTTLDLAVSCTTAADGTQVCAAAYTPDGSEGSLAPIFVIHE